MDVNFLLVGVFCVGYYVVGVFWACFRWYVHLLQLKNNQRLLTKDFMKFYDCNGNYVPPRLRDLWEAELDYAADRWPHYFSPKPGRHCVRLIFWILCWPCDIFVLVVEVGFGVLMLNQSGLRTLMRQDLEQSERLRLSGTRMCDGQQAFDCDAWPPVDGEEHES